METQNPIPLSKWEKVGNVWPTVHAWHNMLRPENLRNELVEAGVVAFVAGRWVIFPDKWRAYAAANHRPRAA
ncbi:MAG: hypothetical protein IH838_00980 [Proteobacteria bacterium]|nr:hypothetical protein [Pseudomonadota bacterium]